jgi:hypothetical protein
MAKRVLVPLERSDVAGAILPLVPVLLCHPGRVSG